MFAKRDETRFRNHNSAAYQGWIIATVSEHDVCCPLPDFCPVRSTAEHVLPTLASLTSNTLPFRLYGDPYILYFLRNSSAWRSMHRRRVSQPDLRRFCSAHRCDGRGLLRHEPAHMARPLSILSKF